MAIDRAKLNGKAKDALKEGLAGLPDGVYEFEHGTYAFKETAGDNLILARTAVVTGGAHDGHKVSWDTFLILKGEEKDRNISQLTKELEALGFPAAAWAEAGVWFDRVEKLTGAVAGVRFRGKKRANASGDKVYQNLDIVERVPTDGKPAKFTDADIEEANRQSIPF